MAAAHAEGTIPARIDGLTVGNFARMHFSWPERVRFKAAARGNELVVTFEKPVDADVLPVLSKLRDFVTSAQTSDDHRTLTFTMTAPYKVRTFITGRYSGIDLLESPAQADAKKAPQVENKPVEDARDSPLPQAEEGTVAAAGGEEKGKKKDGTVTRAPVGAVASADAPELETGPRPSPAPAQAAAPAVEKPVTPPVPVTPLVEQPPLAVTAEAVKDGARVTFRWPHRVEYRIFKRPDQLLIEFDDTLPATPPVPDEEVARIITGITAESLKGRLSFLLSFPGEAEFRHWRQNDAVVLEVTPQAKAPDALAGVAPQDKPQPENMLAASAAESQQASADGAGGGPHPNPLPEAEGTDVAAGGAQNKNKSAGDVDGSGESGGEAGGTLTLTLTLGLEKPRRRSRFLALPARRERR